MQSKRFLKLELKVNSNTPSKHQLTSDEDSQEVLRNTR